MKKILSLLLVFSFVISLSINVFGFTTVYEDEEGKQIRLTDFLDTQGHWAHDMILKWADYNIIQGNNGSFMPNNAIIRGDLAIIMDRMLGLKNTTYNYFSDLHSEDYYRESILKCVAAGYINGVGNNQVNPKGNATREEVAVILCRVFNIDTNYSGNTGFKDDSSISSWARSSVYALSRLGYLNGTPDGRVNPKSNITRAEMITLLSNFADTYIPRVDGDNSGTTFVSNFPKNLVLSRNIELYNSTVGRDIYTTQSVSSLSLSSSKVLGRVVCFSNISLALNNTSVSQVYLCDGKSSLSGVSDMIDEVYVTLYASESSLDNFPNKLVLEPGARVRVNNIMYENETSRVKTYNASTLKENISDEQGYVVGGPRISYSSATLSYENTLTFKGIRVIEGNNEIRELGVVWLESEEDEEPINPTYKKNDGKERYDGAYYEPFDFELEDIEGYCTYRLYVRDRDGLYAYSSPITISSNEFRITMDISEENYPRSLQADVIFRGENIPRVNSVQVIYAEDDLYSENRQTTTLRKYVEDYAENPTDDTKYLRFTGVINSPSQWVNGETVYNVPTAFGYIITFGDGSLINRFPILSDVIPEGIDPVSTLTAGSVTFGDNRLIINNSKVVTNLVSVEEVGIAYKESSSSTSSNPSSSWIRVSGGRNIDVKETYTFNTTIPITDTSLNTFYAPYVKTSNGYFYGEVSKVENNWLGDEGGPTISNPIVMILNENTAVVKLSLISSEDIIDFEKCIYSAVKDSENYNGFSSYTLRNLDYHKTESSLYLRFDNLTADTLYNINFYIKNTSGLKSNICSIPINTKEVINISLLKKESSDARTKYSIMYPTSSIIDGVFNINMEPSGHSLINSLVGRVEPYSYLSDDSIFVYDVENLQNQKVLLTIDYILYKGTMYQKNYTFTRTFDLY